MKNGEALDSWVIIQPKNKVGNIEVTDLAKIKNKLSFGKNCVVHELYT